MMWITLTEEQAAYMEKMLLEQKSKLTEQLDIINFVLVQLRNKEAINEVSNKATQLSQLPYSTHRRSSSERRMPKIGNESLIQSLKEILTESDKPVVMDILVQGVKAKYSELLSGVGSYKIADSISNCIGRNLNIFERKGTGNRNRKYALKDTVNQSLI